MTAGYQALRERAAWLDVSARGRIKVTGEDRARLLHAMSTNNIQGLQPGEGCYAFFLSAQGRILADANILCRPEYLLLDTEPETGNKLLQHLEKFIIADDAYVENITVSSAAIALEGPRAEAVLSALKAPIPAEPCGNLEWGERLIVRAGLTGGPGFSIVTSATDRDALVRAILETGAQGATDDDFATVRIEHGRPRYGEDMSERFLAQETNQARALNFEKGCYLGQEIVERVRSRAQIHRLLTPLEIATDEPPVPGTKLQADGVNVAEITSSAFSPALGKVVALGYVRVSHAELGALLTLGNAEVRVRKM